MSTHRGHGHAIAKGHEPRLMMAELLGRATGYCRGRGGSMHVSSLALRNLGANGVVAGGMPLAVGAAFAIRLKGETDIVVSFCSDGASANGAFHEALNLAAIYHLPVVFVLENNHYAVSTPIRDSALVDDLSERAAGYGMPGVTVDGNDALVVLDAMTTAVARARAGDGPTLIECKTYRHGGHHVNDPGLYLPKEELERWRAHDPVDVLRQRLHRTGHGRGRHRGHRPARRGRHGRGGRVRRGQPAARCGRVPRRGRRVMTRMQVPRRAPARAHRGDGPRPARVRHGRGHRRAGRLVQGHGGSAGPVRARHGSSTRP